MLEYIFFDVSLRDQFVVFVQDMAIDCELRDDNMGMLVRVPDEISDEQVETLEEKYEALQDEQSQMLSETEGGFASLASFSLVLPDGSLTSVPLQPDVANRLLESFSIDEIQALFSTVARCALAPEEQHVCKMLHDSKKSI